MPILNEQPDFEIWSLIDRTFKTDIKSWIFTGIVYCNMHLNSLVCNQRDINQRPTDPSPSPASLVQTDQSVCSALMETPICCKLMILIAWSSFELHKMWKIQNLIFSRSQSSWICEFWRIIAHFDEVWKFLEANDLWWITLNITLLIIT